jgi:transposase
MDTSRRGENEKAVGEEARMITPKRQRRTVEEKRRIVEETMVEGASVARVARANGVNANQVFDWKKQYLSGRLGKGGAVELLAVRVSADEPAAVASARTKCSAAVPGTIHVELNRAQVRIEGGADAGLLRVVLESLRR